MAEKPLKCVGNHLHSEFSSEMEKAEIRKRGDEF